MKNNIFQKTIKKIKQPRVYITLGIIALFVVGLLVAPLLLKPAQQKKEMAALLNMLILKDKVNSKGLAMNYAKVHGTKSIALTSKADQNCWMNESCTPEEIYEACIELDHVMLFWEDVAYGSQNNPIAEFVQQLRDNPEDAEELIDQFFNYEGLNLLSLGPDVTFGNFDQISIEELIALFEGLTPEFMLDDLLYPVYDEVCTNMYGEFGSGSGAGASSY